MTAEPTLYEKIQDRVISGEFPPGQRLKSDVLRKDYGVSASSIREVLFRLSTVGLVDFFEQRGFRVPQLSKTLLTDLTMVRIMLESEGACLSIQHGGVAWEARLNAAHHELKYIENQAHASDQNPDILGLWSAAELKFHRTLIEECHSEILQAYHLQTYHRFRQQVITCDRDLVYVPESIEQHQSILDAVLERDEALVRERISHHLSRDYY